MFQASISVGALIDSVAEGMGLYTEVDRSVYRDILNECLCTLYSTVIDERAMCTGESVNGTIFYNRLTVPAGQSDIRAGDVRGVLYGERPLQYVSAELFPLVATADGDFYTLKEDGIYLSPARSGAVLQVLYTVRPRRYKAEDEEETLPFPNEHLSLLRAKLRGEAYKLANEDGFAAKWLGEYNTTLAAFAAVYGRKD